MRTAILLLCLTYFNFTYGQFAIINDYDGYTNVRKAGDKKSHIIDKLKNEHLVYSFEDKVDWVNIDYYSNRLNKLRNGFIYKNRYTLVSSYQSIPLVKLTKDSVILKRGNVEVVVSQQGFVKNKHKYEYVTQSSESFIATIDNKIYWGTDGGLPTSEYESIQVKLGHDIIKLPQSAIANLYQPNIFNTVVNFNQAKNIIYIHSVNSDGAGSYEVIWKIENGKYKERFIAYGF